MKYGQRGRGFGRPGGWQQADLPDAADASDWFAGRLPSDWFAGPATLEIDRDEIVVIGELPIPPSDAASARPTTRTSKTTAAADGTEAAAETGSATGSEVGDGDPAAVGADAATSGTARPADVPRATRDGLVARFRETTRPARMQIAAEAQHRYGRTVSWGVRVGDERIMFTHVAAPVMTRLRQPERKVLDTLVDAGVARSRSDALAWTVKLAGQHAEAWLAELREAMRKVDELRAEGPRDL
ncbi:hypothetical protein [Nocardia otitidiscaviarum]|uniref:hypothetical protein n=1 Tax=Nocardia otitidiscaviarum TaxID=1823 RepID=UPI001895D69E|nr:hypothetical protein [Nocardia otitidiscaviarum]MBF6183273.1 hypothetical protein [Nocardia otitidiscaviarum]